jgi:hypothetical protein
VSGGLVQRRAYTVTMFGCDAGQHFFSGDRTATAPTQHDRRDVRHDDLVASEVPLPDSAVGGLDRQAKALLALDPSPPHPIRAPALQQQPQRKGAGDQQGQETAETLTLLPGRREQGSGQRVGCKEQQSDQ